MTLARSKSEPSSDSSQRVVMLVPRSLASVKRAPRWKSGIAPTQTGESPGQNTLKLPLIVMAMSRPTVAL
jgi:hypothetical protein